MRSASSRSRRTRFSRSATRSRTRALRKLPIVASAPRFRAYAGHPLADEHGNCVGTFCVFDLKPREFGAADRQTLADLAALAQRELLSDQLTTAHAALTSKLGVARREAIMDPLTHLWNRRGASVLLKAAFANADQRGTPLALALLDLDNFKRVNDNHGHQTGDEVLRRVASRLLSAVRGDDAICRHRRRRVLGPDGRYGRAPSRTGWRSASGTRSPTPPCRRATARCRCSVSVGCTVRQPRDTTAGRSPARARRSSVDAVESRWPQSRADDELTARGLLDRPNRAALPRSFPLRYHPVSSRAMARCHRPVTNQWGIPWPNESMRPRRTPSIVATF